MQQYVYADHIIPSTRKPEKLGLGLAYIPTYVYPTDHIKRSKKLLVSSLTRRVFPDDPHNATDSLHNERLAAIQAAEATGSIIIDLNAASLAYIDAIGRDAAWAYNWGDDRADMTHLNPYGEVVFGRMVADLIIRAKPDLKRWIAPNETLSYAIWNNLPA